MDTVFCDIPIQQLCTKVTAGSTPLRSRSDYYEGGTIDWYKTGELKDWYLGPAKERITEKALEETSVKLFPANTVLMAMYGDGSTITSLGMLRVPAATNQACSAMFVDERKCDPSYFFYALKARRHLLLKLASGGAQRNLNGKLIKEFRLPVPPLPVQRRIADILSTYDKLMENSQRRIWILETMARALYREWFMHFRFPGHENVPMIRSPSRLDEASAKTDGKIPQGWEVKKLKDVADVNRTQINARTAPDELHYIDISSVSPGQIDSITTYAFADAPGRARRIVKHGDVLWSCVRPNRRSHVQVMHPEPDTIASTGFAVLTATKVPCTFLYSSTTTDDFVAYLTNNATGAAYVRARVAEQGFVRQGGDEATRSNFKTGDATTDSYIQTLEGELAQLRGQLKNLRSVIAIQGEYDLTTTLNSGKLMISQGHQNELPFPVVDAIRAILDTKLLRQVGLELMPTGQIAAPDLSNAILLNKAQVEALKSVLVRHKHPDLTRAIKEK